jgi:uncharacterized protein (DUF58 family)
MAKGVFNRSTPARLCSLFFLSLLTGLFALTSAVGAQATTGTGQQNPRLAVTVSLSPDTASNGDVVTATETVRNTSSVKRTVALTGTLTTPDGRTLSRSGTVVLKPGQTSTQSQTYTVTPSDARGTYTLRLDASNRNGTSSATATVTYV